MSHLNYKTAAILLVVCGLIQVRSVAQSPSFIHLTANDGLTDNYIRSIAIDKKGFLWLGGDEGINEYDGNSVKTYNRETFPQMPTNVISALYCDNENNTWFGSNEGAGWIDSRKQVQRVALQDTILRFGCQFIQEVKPFGIILFTSRGQYYQQSPGKWKLLEKIPFELRKSKCRDVQPFNAQSLLFVTDSLVAVWDYVQQKMLKRIPVLGAIGACRLTGDEVAVAIQAGLVQVMDINSGSIERQYPLSFELAGKRINFKLLDIERAANGSLIVSGGYDGLIIIDSNGGINRYTHDPFDPRSLISSNIFKVFTGRNGEVILATATSGLSMFNVYSRKAGYTGFFIDDASNYIDNFVINKIAEDEKGNLWLSTQDRLIHWDKKNNKSKFYYYYLPQPVSGLRSADLRGLCFDRRNRLWVDVAFDCLAILDPSTGNFKKVSIDTSLGPSVRNYYIPDMILASDGKIWAGSGGGIFTIDPENFKVDALTNHPLLKEISGQRVNGLFEDRQHRIWIASNSAGVYCYDPIQNKLHHYTKEQGLVSDISYMIRDDSKGNIYISASDGLSVLSPGGSFRTYNKASGLRYDRVESVIVDDNDKVWFSNRRCMVKLDPATNTLEIFDEAAGFLNEGYRVGNCMKSRTGEIFWSGYKGVSYFTPALLVKDTLPLQVSIFNATTSDSSLYFRDDQKIKIPYSSNSISFRFAAMQLGRADKIQYQYQLEGYDKQWQTSNQPQARYVSLPPGRYTFQVRASRDGKTWFEASNNVNLTIIPPLWRKWWFIALSFSVVIGGIYWLFQNRNKKISQQKEQLEKEQAINYFATSIAEQQTVENILWDVARNCISQFQFEDCVIYLWDEKDDMLIQKAAHGPKSPKQFEIEKPIGIQPGRGIVGTVALSGKAEIIPDTTKDPRYIVDDEQRFSEISVPIKSGDKVLGVIDCEHSKKAFFTQKHLSILTTIASLCANKIVRVRAEEEKRQAQMILMSTQQKMTEVEMQALRAQMNPHFIFNCLNSINRYIVKSDQVTASLYLTKFAKLIRLILDNSNSKNVILSNELEALKLYIEMEALRFDKKFTYTIEVEENMGTDSIEVPPLIIQPYVENAIWHGLLHKEDNGHLSIRLSMASEGMLQCIIEDNGIGRSKARELKSKTATSRKSLGMQLTENRLSLLNKHAALNASIEIIDLENGSTKAAGTRVILKIPV